MAKQIIKVSDIQENGHGVGRDEEGLVYFVKGLIPGDTAEITVGRKIKNYRLGFVETILESSPDRVIPFCEHYEFCGGCQIQHMKYTSQLEWKSSKVEKSFEKIGQIEVREKFSIEASPEQTHYKNKLEFSASSKRWLTGSEITSKEKLDRDALGFHVEKKFDRVTHIENCHLQDDYSNFIRNTIFATLKKHKLSFHNPYSHEGDFRNVVIRNNSEGVWMVVLIFGTLSKEKRTLFLEDLKSLLKEDVHIIYGHNLKKNDDISDLQLYAFNHDLEMQETLKRKDELKVLFKIGAQSFFQTNIEQTQNIFNAILNQLETLKSQTVLDLFCGVGSISLFIAPYVQRVIGIEYSETSILNARENAQLNNIANTQFYVANLNQAKLSSFCDVKDLPDTVICDPPRSGLSSGLVEELLTLRPQNIIYLSCNPDTQARDIALLSEAYSFEWYKPFDMFPHTTHIENLAFLKLK